MTARQLEKLTVQECHALLASRHVGRLVYVDDEGPVAVPVNYRMAGDDIVFRVSGGTKLDAVRRDPVAFEVDQVDEQTHAGWSVVVRGTGREVSLSEVADLLPRMEQHVPSPWAAGVHNFFLLITPSSITGRRLGDVAEPLVF